MTNEVVKVIHKQLPEFCVSGRPLKNPQGIVIHYFSARNVDKDNEFDLECCRNLFVDLNLPMDERTHYMKSKPWGSGRMYASAHFLVGRDGEIWQLVDLGKQAYHAGASILGGREHCNNWTIGIEMVGHQHSEFTDEQYQSLAGLIVRFRADYNIPLELIAGHDQVRFRAVEAGKTTKHKYDPSGRKDGRGDNFDWGKLFLIIDSLEIANEMEVESGVV